MTEYLERVIRPRMSTIEGVAEIEIIGAANYAMRVWIDPLQLAARGVTAAEVLDGDQRLELPRGAGHDRERVRRLQHQHADDAADAGGLRRAAAARRGRRGGAPARRRDGSSSPPRSRTRSSPSTASPAPSSASSRRRRPTRSTPPRRWSTSCRRSTPACRRAWRSSSSTTSTETISASIEEVFKTIAEAVAIVVVVILLFLGSFRSVLMPIVTIPLSLIGVCSLLLALGYSINLLSLLAMVLAIGLVVDDAIVVVENIHRHIEEGLTPARRRDHRHEGDHRPGDRHDADARRRARAARLHRRPDRRALPRVRLHARGRGHHLGRRRADDHPDDGGADPEVRRGAAASSASSTGASTGVANWYERRVSSSLDYRPMTMLMVLALVGATGFMFLKTTTELAPEEDEGALFAILNGPRYATLDYTHLYTDQISQLTAGIHEVTHRVLDRRLRRQPQLRLLHLGAQGLGRSRPLAGGDAAGPPGPARQGRRRRGLRLRAADAAGLRRRPADHRRHPVDPRRRRGSTRSPRRSRQKAQASGRFIVVQNSLAFDAPQVDVTIDRDRAASLNVPVSEVGSTLGLLVGGGSIGQFDRDSNSYDIITQVPREFRDNPEALGEFFVRAADRRDGPAVRRWSPSRPAAPPPRSSSSTSSTRRRSRRCRCPASRPATASPRSSASCRRRCPRASSSTTPASRGSR